MYKILFVATYPNQPIGYSKIANKLSNIIANIPNIKLYYFGFANFDRSRINDRYIHPNITFIDVVKEEKLKGNNELYGVNILEDTILTVQPDMIFIYNDIVVLCRLINSIVEYRKRYIQTFKIITYLDLVYDFEKPLFINHVINNTQKIIVFSEHWMKNMIDMGCNPNKLSVLYHGFNNDIFKPVDKITARKSFGIAENDFVILNLNRNSYRKALDITIRAYLMFMKKINYPDNVKLFLQCDTENNSGYDIKELLYIESIRLNIPKEHYEKIINNCILRLNMPIYDITDVVINNLYNACDVGINTCVGEGFGLCNLEHACLGKPQVISNVGALRDIFSECDTKDLIIEPKLSLYISKHTDEHAGYIYICDPSDVCEALYKVYNNYNYYQLIYQKLSLKLQDKYNWNSIQKQLEDIITGETFYLH
jgi:glycosyltransferase involved in cell wall biosynthesis